MVCWIQHVPYLGHHMAVIMLISMATMVAVWPMHGQLLISAENSNGFYHEIGRLVRTVRPALNIFANEIIR